MLPLIQGGLSQPDPISGDRSPVEARIRFGFNYGMLISTFFPLMANLRMNLGTRGTREYIARMPLISWKDYPGR